MKNNFLIVNALTLYADGLYPCDILIKNGLIDKIRVGSGTTIQADGFPVFDAKGMFLMPGVIDDQVHFREPGLTHKAEIASESKACIAGGITSFMEMPNTNPQTTSINALEDKYLIAQKSSWANYSFYLGATNDNISELRKFDVRHSCGIKVFMGSSTGNMLVDNAETLKEIFAIKDVLIAIHSEDEATISGNMARYKSLYGTDIKPEMHPEIRNHEACLVSTQRAIKLAKELNTRLHVLHISTAEELELFSSEPLSDMKRITAEVCVHHLWFDANDYARFGNLIKWNPSIKYTKDRDALRKGLLENKLDVIATDHAPHTWEEKQRPYLEAPSGGPMVQHSLNIMIELYKQGLYTLQDIITKMCHNPAKLFGIEGRGYIKEGFHADLVLVDLDKSWNVGKDNLYYKCGWSALENQRFSSYIDTVFVNGNMVYNNGTHCDFVPGNRLVFNK